MAADVPTAALLVIGDEILKGHTQDTNSSFAARILFRLGVRLSRIVVVSDDKELIASEVRTLSAGHTFVVTSGGVGPTHDDVTYEAVAAAFDMPVVHSKELAQVVRTFYGLGTAGSPNSKNSALKMAHVPEEHTLLYAEEPRLAKKKLKWSPVTFPIVRVKNVYVFPGLPVCFEACFEGLQHIFPSALGSRFSDIMYLTIEESEISDILEETINEFKVVIGCYPILGEASYQTKLTVEGSRLEQLRAAQEYIRAKVPADTVVDLFPTKVALEQLRHLGSHDSAAASFELLGQCFDKYRRGEIVVSFNGGKDCTLLLHLYHLYLRSKGLNGSKIKALYIKNQEPFPEVESFIDKAIKTYNLELIVYKDHIKAGVQKLMDEHKQVQAILMGNRRTDPYSSNLSSFQMTDEGWPQVMRVFPLLDWSYGQVWQALLLLGVEYCSLYDNGYSSLGHPANTAPNPALAFKGEDGSVSYRPAHSLVNGAEERAGRQKK